MIILETLLLLLFAHWICDYPLQGDFLAKAKKDGPLPLYHLVAHAGIHAGAVFLVTNIIWFALVEWVLHIIIDHLKNREITSFKQDQTLHILCKIGYVAALF